ncbi:MAG: hypothetical protein HUU50_14065 [Candidatus Brocadiae bacterium]|nr:hypothetical protein [Candidatus Brocadiia bacterium]
MIFIELKCGRSVYISDFDYTRTYGGLIEGMPNEKLNNKIIECAMIRMQLIWGKRKTHLIPPKIDTSDPKHPSLPSTQLTAYIVCNDPVNNNYMGSELVIVWYIKDEDFESSSMRDVTAAALNSINWNDLAQDFDW